MTCVCDTVKNKANFMEISIKDKIYLYNKRCPTHGIELLSEYPMIPYREKKWFTKAQLVMAGRRWENPILLETSADKQRGLVEITLYRVMTDEEKEEYDNNNQIS